MTDVIASLFIDVYPSKHKVTLFRIGNYFLIVSTVSAYSLRQMLLRVVVDGRTRSSRNDLYDRRSSRIDRAFHGLCAKQIVTWGSDYTCLGDIRNFQSPYLPVWNVLSVISVSMDIIGYQISFFSANLLLWFREFLVSSGWPKLFHPPSNWSIQWPLTLLIRVTLRCELLPASVSPLSWSRVLMDGEYLDDTR